MWLRLDVNTGKKLLRGPNMHFVSASQLLCTAPPHRSSTMLVPHCLPTSLSASSCSPPWVFFWYQFVGFYIKVFDFCNRQSPAPPHISLCLARGPTETNNVLPLETIKFFGRKNTNIWRLNNTFSLYNKRISNEIKKEIKICIEMNENDNTTPNLWHSVKAVLRGRFTAIQAYLKNQEKNQINNLTVHLKQWEKEEMKNPRVRRRKEIIKIRAEINEKVTKQK